MCDVRHGGYTPNESTEETKDLRLGIFFDGTRNNKNNIQARIDNTESYRKYGKNTSYQNDLSNVARLWKFYKKEKNVYVEGIGTEDNEPDSGLSGSGLGRGETGIPAKMQIGCEKVAKMVASESQKIRYLYLDVFGFSRGAAAARHFVHEISKPQNRSENIPAWGYLGELLNGKVDMLQIRFLGLFDTVSSFSEGFSLLPDFSNDVDELKLNDIGKAHQIVHFTAADEHRKNFALTRLPQLPTHIGIEKEFPGEHCDIGGSHQDGEEEIKELDISDLFDLSGKLRRLKQQLMEESWYTDEEIEIRRHIVAKISSLYGKRNLLKTYSYIPLHFMAELSKDKQDVPIGVEDLKSEYPIESDFLLQQVESRLRRYVIDNDEGPYFYDKSQNTAEQINLQALRNKYLHWPSNYEGLVDVNAPAKNRERIEY